MSWIPKATIRRETTYTLELFKDDILRLLQGASQDDTSLAEIGHGAEVDIVKTPYREGDGPLGNDGDGSHIVVTWKVVD